MSSKYDEFVAQREARERLARDISELTSRGWQGRWSFNTGRPRADGTIFHTAGVTLAGLSAQYIARAIAEQWPAIKDHALRLADADLRKAAEAAKKEAELVFDIVENAAATSR